MKLLESLSLGPRTAPPNRVLFGPHVTNLGDDDRRFTARHTAYYERRARGGCGTIVVEGASVHESDWPYERAPLAAVAADGLGGDRRRLPPARRARHRLARPRRRAGLVARTASARCGHRRGSPRWQRREVPKWMEADDIAAVVAGFAAAAAWPRRRRLRRRRDQRRPAQPGAPVPLRAHEPARRRVGHRPPALRPRRHRRRCARRVGADRIVGPAPVVRRAGAVGRHHARHGPGDRRRARRVPASTTSSSCAARSSRSSRLDPTSTSRPASTSASPRPSPRPSTCRSCCRARSSTCGQAEWARRRLRRPGAVRRRRDDAGPDRRPRPRRQAAGRARRSRSGRAPAATRRARSATPATRS